jgi:hypothetical protein
MKTNLFDQFIEFVWKAFSGFNFNPIAFFAGLIATLETYPWYAQKIFGCILLIIGILIGFLPGPGGMLVTYPAIGLIHKPAQVWIDNRLKTVKDYILAVVARYRVLVRFKVIKNSIFKLKLKRVFTALVASY